MKHPLSFANEYYKWIEKTFKVTLHPSIYRNQMSKRKKKFVNNSLNLYKQLYLDSV